MMLRAVSLCVGRDIHILHDNGHTTKLEQELKTHGPLFLGLIGERHYVSLHLQCNLTQTDLVSEPVCMERNENAVCEPIGSSVHPNRSKRQHNDVGKTDSNDTEPRSQFTESVVESSLISCNNSNCEWPPIWSEDVWFEKKKSYPFLVCKDGKIGCEVCQNVGSVKNCIRSWDIVSCGVDDVQLRQVEEIAEINLLPFVRKSSSTHVLKHTNVP